MRALFASLAALMLVACAPSSPSPVLFGPGADAGDDATTLVPPPHPSCPSGAGVETFLTRSGIDDIAVDDESLYFATSIGVFARSLTAGTERQIATGQISRVKIDREAVYYKPQFTNATLRRVPKVGGTPITLVDGSLQDKSTVKAPLTLEFTFSPKHVFASLHDGRIVMGTKTGLATATLIRGLLSELPTLALDTFEDRLFYATHQDIRSIPFTGGTSKVLASKVSPGVALVTDGARVYFIHERDPKGLLSVTVGGGDLQMHVGGQYFEALARDGSHLYWTRNREVGRMPLGGGSLALIACGTNLRGLAVNSTHVYWMTEGAVYRAKKTWSAEPLDDGCVANGTSCAKSECCKGFCDRDVCGACRPRDHECNTATDCCSGVCFAPGGSYTKLCGCYTTGTSCTNDRQCCTDKCLDGRCGGLSCYPPTVKCGDKCLDVSKDPKNCGGCGVVCGAGENCCSGVCRTCLCAGMVFDGGSGSSPNCTPCCSKSCDSSKAPTATNWSSVCNK